MNPVNDSIEVRPQRPSALIWLLVRLYLILTTFGLLFFASLTRPFPTLFFFAVAGLFLMPNPETIARALRISLRAAQCVYTPAAVVAVSAALYAFPWGNDFWINVFAATFALAMFCWMEFFWPKVGGGGAATANQLPVRCKK